MSVNYMLISIIILAVAIAIPFFTFEKRKPKARHVVMIAVMSALTVVANIICAYTIPLHAGTELVIITGIAFGPQTGFLTGVLSRFVCNFFMGQGVWTPWEMAAWGLLGVLAGIAFYKPELVGYFDDKKEIVRKQARTGLSVMAVPVVCMVVSELVGYIVYLFHYSDNIYIYKCVCYIWWNYEYCSHDDEQHIYGFRQCQYIMGGTETSVHNRRAL